MLIFNEMVFVATINDVKINVIAMSDVRDMCDIVCFCYKMRTGLSPANQLKISSYVNNNTISDFHQRPRFEGICYLILIDNLISNCRHCHRRE